MPARTHARTHARTITTRIQKINCMVCTWSHATTEFKWKWINKKNDGCCFAFQRGSSPEQLFATIVPGDSGNSNVNDQQFLVTVERSTNECRTEHGNARTAGLFDIDASHRELRLSDERKRLDDTESFGIQHEHHARTIWPNLRQQRCWISSANNEHDEEARKLQLPTDNNERRTSDCQIREQDEQGALHLQEQQRRWETIIHADDFGRSAKVGSTVQCHAAASFSRYAYATSPPTAFTPPPRPAPPRPAPPRSIFKLCSLYRRVLIVLSPHK